MSGLAATVFSTDFAAQSLKGAVPFALAAMGGAVTERSGVIDLALEAKLLFGAFAAAAICYVTGSPYAGLLGGIAAGMVIAAIQVGCALGLGAHQVIVGMALNVLALSGTRFLLQVLFHEGSNSPRTADFGASVVGDPIVWLAVVAAIAVPFALRRMRWGMRLRAAGDRPEALVAVGVSPTRARLAAALVGGGLAGAGGAHISLSVGGFVADMAGGRGYMALAMVILSGWRPAWAVLACLGIAVAQSLATSLQITNVAVPHELSVLLPHVTTLAVLVIFGGRSPPRALGRT